MNNAEAAMGDHTDIPCRVSAETRQHYAAQNSAEAPEFDPTDENELCEVVSKEIAKPLAALFSALQQVEMCQGSFGVDAKKALDWLVPELKELRTALRDEWRANL